MIENDVKVIAHKGNMILYQHADGYCDLIEETGKESKVLLRSCLLRTGKAAFEVLTEDFLK